MQSSGTPFVGVTRFSVASPQGSGLNIVTRHNNDRQAYLAELFDEGRLRNRFHIFGELSAPIYQEFSENYNYVHLVQYSQGLPQEWKEKLDAIAKQYPAIRPVLVTNESIYDTVRKHVLTWRGDFRGMFVWLRVDDDDLLATDYLDALSEHVRPETTGMVVSYPTLASAVYSDGWIGDFHKVYQLAPSQGQAYVCRANVSLRALESPPMTPHHLVYEQLPTITVPGEPYALWLRHAEQDTQGSTAKLGARLSNLQGGLGASPIMTSSAVKRKFPTIVDAQPQGNFDTPPPISLRPGEWATMSQHTTGWPQQINACIDYTIDFREAPHSGTTLTFDFDGSSGDGHFPQDDNRGKYRRAFVDQFGHGRMFVHLASPQDLTRVRILVDPGKGAINSATLTITPMVRK